MTRPSACSSRRSGDAGTAEVTPATPGQTARRPHGVDGARPGGVRASSVRGVSAGCERECARSCPQSGQTQRRSSPARTADQPTPVRCRRMREVRRPVSGLRDAEPLSEATRASLLGSSRASVTVHRASGLRRCDSARPKETTFSWVSGNAAMRSATMRLRSIPRNLIRRRVRAARSRSMLARRSAGHRLIRLGSLWDA